MVSVTTVHHHPTNYLYFLHRNYDDIISDVFDIWCVWCIWKCFDIMLFSNYFDVAFDSLSIIWTILWNVIQKIWRRLVGSFSLTIVHETPKKYSFYLARIILRFFPFLSKKIILAVPQNPIEEEEFVELPSSSGIVNKTCLFCVPRGHQVHWA
jgi:hypothetical protein